MTRPSQGPYSASTASAMRHGALALAGADHDKPAGWLGRQGMAQAAHRIGDLDGTVEKLAQKRQRVRHHQSFQLVTLG